MQTSLVNKVHITGSFNEQRGFSFSLVVIDMEQALVIVRSANFLFSAPANLFDIAWTSFLWGIPVINETLSARNGKRLVTLPLRLPKCK